MKRIDSEAARRRFEHALDTHEQTFGKHFLASLIGLEFEFLPHEAEDPDKETCRISFEVDDMFLNPQGSLHGGIVATVMDISMGHLVATTAGAGATVEMKVQYMRPVGLGKAVCEGRFLRRGRTLSFMESRLYRSDGELASLATATWKMP